MTPSEMDEFARQWPEQRERWKRLHDWENARLRELPLDFSAALAWMWQARELALRHDPEWSSSTRHREHWIHLAEIQRRLALGRLAP